MSAELTVARAVGGAVMAGWFAYLAHRLPVAEFGRLALILSLGSLVGMLSDLGIPLALTKLSCDHDSLCRRVVASAIGRRIIGGAGAALLLTILWINAGRGSELWLGAFYGVAVVLAPITHSFIVMLRGRAIAGVEALHEIGSKTALLAFGLLAIQVNASVVGLVVVYVVVEAISSLVIPFLARRRLRFSDDYDRDQSESMTLRRTLPLTAEGVLGNTYERVDIWLLALLKGSASVALYAAAYQLHDGVLLPAGAMSSSAIAAAGRDVNNARPVARRLAVRAGLITALLAFVVIVVAPLVMKVGFGSKYGHGSSALAVLMVAAIPGGALLAITPIVLVYRRSYALKWTAAGLAANVLANFILVPTVGVRGAALAYLMTEALLLVVFLGAIPAPRAEPATGAEPDIAPALAAASG